jgi:hypothetical protein
MFYLLVPKIDFEEYILGNLGYALMPPALHDATIEPLAVLLQRTHLRASAIDSTSALSSRHPFIID